ncbi:NADPH-dependent FMN reductase [Undibacterium terreum]|uniref:FMN reductase n=1 Tax=Undibacterium terreum TaxID=1224302 RepID=A0A916UJY5_9BURK|nr:NAD(P)H-dependent oxidoreductase [Undibacterium terreum]GGC73670.1 FMN reductase [Undibacterium terreum]
MKLLAFAASNSSKSINKKLVSYAAGLVEGAQVEVLDLNDFELPLYSSDREAQLGQPALAKAFLQKIADSDAILISFAEHNGSYSAAYKNLFDWCSRINPKVYQNKPAVFLSTSPGPGGAANVLASAKTSAPYFTANLKASLSVPRFNENFDAEAGALRNADLQKQLLDALSLLNAA